MRTIRAAEIGVFLYCRRAWWYRMQGIAPANQAELSSGSELHRRHGRQVFLANLLRLAGWALLLAALVLLAVYLTVQVLK
jgi:CRISPR/Cas system-associated exonuclease Cas4 (RecB family)